AFVSSRTGHPDLYVLDFSGGDVRQLTHDDGFVGLDGWSRDGATLYFDSQSHQVGFTPSIMEVPADGGTPTNAIRERYWPTRSAAPQPGSDAIAYADGGFGQWWRRGHAHIDEGAIALYRPGTPPHFEQLSTGGAVENWPMWSADGRTLYYDSDRSGAPNLWAVSPGGRPRQLTRFTNGRLVWPSISSGGASIVFERDFGVWRYDVAGGQPRQLRIELRGAATQLLGRHVTLTSRFTELALSPDGKKVVFAADGQLFAASAHEGGDGVRVTHTAAKEYDAVWAPDSRRIAYVSDRDGKSALFLYDFATSIERRLTPAENDYAPQFSPDGHELAYLRNGREVRVLDLASRQVRTLARGELDDDVPFGSKKELTFSPDGRRLAFVMTVVRGFTSVEVASLAGGPAQPIEDLANANAGPIVWTPDGERVYFATGQRTEQGTVAQIDLVPRTPRFREDQFHQLFVDTQPRREQPEPQASPSVLPMASSTPRPNPKSSTAPHSRQVRIDFDGIRDRASLLPVAVDVNDITLTRDAKTLVLDATAAGEDNIYTYSIDELAAEEPVAKQITATREPKSDLAVAPDDSVYYLEAGRAFVAMPDGKTRPLSLSADLDVDYDKTKLEDFAEAWRDIDQYYADPNFNGVDWAAVHERYAPYVRGAHNPAEIVRLLNLMVGELDSSHLGVAAPRDPHAARSGYLGAEFDPGAYRRAHRLRISELLPLGPLGLSGRVHVGDELEAVDGTPLDAHTNVEALLEDKIGKRIVVRVSGHDVPVAPIDAEAAAALRYRAWVDSRRALVDRLSGGRLGYVHIFDMSEDALARLAVDLDIRNQSKAGVVIDIRNNEGGFVDPYVTDIFSRRNYVDFKDRGDPIVPERPSLGQRALDRPTVLLVNRYSLSDSENFTQDYRSAHLGKVVGEPTAGWIIFTYGTTLVDGTRFRIPHTKTLTTGGGNMELHPRPVDVHAARRLGEDLEDDDAQLAAAVKTLLREAHR
ncbi:MAG: S41 family peptidase, partial [Candidatus Eremiobacteraeota bacterium]|nr:S41 family peptidase [Candidatus Eremiobacteraeota bacterium]